MYKKLLLSLTLITTVTQLVATQPGVLDTTFNPAPAIQPGTVSTTIDGGTDNSGNAVAIQANGKIVIAGETFVAGDYRFGLARFNTDGSLDTTFAGDGTTSTTIDGGTSNIGSAVAIQADGKIVVAGYTDVAGDSRFGLARFFGDPTAIPTVATNTCALRFIQKYGARLAVQ